MSLENHSDVVTSEGVRNVHLETDGLVTPFTPIQPQRPLWESALRYPASVSNLCVIPGSVCSAHFTPSEEKSRP